jgi:hypothetical protein
MSLMQYDFKAVLFKIEVVLVWHLATWQNMKNSTYIIAGLNVSEFILGRTQIAEDHVSWLSELVKIRFDTPLSQVLQYSF